MACRVDAGWVAGFVCVCTLITQMLCVPVEEPRITKTKEPASLQSPGEQQYVSERKKRVMDSLHKLAISANMEPASLLSPGEQQYVSERKKRVMDSLHKLAISANMDSVPHIALLGSGGGQRATVALLGSLHQMGQDDLLDTLLYLGGVSGSGWAMSFLYTDPMWSDNMTAALARLTGSGPELDDVLDWLVKRSDDQLFSLSDLWGSIVSPTLLKQMDQHRLSDEAKRRTTTNPYPVYNALDQSCQLNGSTKDKWFELTPHESGFTELNLFIPTSQLGSHTVEEGMEEADTGFDMDMVSLKGVIGSAMADKEAVLGYLPDWLRDALGIAFINKNNLLDIFLWKDGTKWIHDTSLQDMTIKMKIRALHVLMRLLATVGEHTEDPTAKAELEQRAARLQDSLKNSPFPSLELVNSQERETMFEEGIEETLKKWTVTLEDGALKDLDGTVSDCLRSKEHIHLVDPGMLLNSPYPPFLGPRRDVDLIISLDFSLGESLKSLIRARDYAAEVHKPFPLVDDEVLEDDAWPKDFYVFPGELSQPTIVYMPLFNQRNCRDAAEVTAKMAEYTTVHLPYNKEQIAALLKIAMANLKNNKHNLLIEINKAAVRKNSRT